MRVCLLLLAFAALALPAAAKKRHIVVAGGCFWCVESDFDKVDGVLATRSGYAGGTVDNPTYRQVVKGKTGHLEVVEIAYDSSVVSLERLLDIFWRTVDPTDAGGQFCDRGFSYTTAIFAGSVEEMALAERSKAAAQKALGQTIVTPVLAAAPFWLAESYHQNYYQNNPLRYKFYRSRCGRDARVKELWGKEAWVEEAKRLEATGG